MQKLGLRKKRVSKKCRSRRDGSSGSTQPVCPGLFFRSVVFTLLVNVYVDLVVFTRIAGTLKTGSGRYWPKYYEEKHAICLKDYRIRSLLSIDDDRYSNLFLNAYINRHAHTEYLKMI